MLEGEDKVSKNSEGFDAGHGPLREEGYVVDEGFDEETADKSESQKS